jgi:hypothetical protein
MGDWLPPRHDALDGHIDYLASLLVVSTPRGLMSRWEDRRPPDDVRSAVAAFAREMSGQDLVVHEHHRENVYLRLLVRDRTPAQAAASGREQVIDFEHGPMGAPPEYPRTSVNELFRHAAETA